MNSGETFSKLKSSVHARVVSYKFTPCQSCWGEIITCQSLIITTDWVEGLTQISCGDVLKAFPFSTKLVSHLHIHSQHCSGLIKHLLNDCLLCLWFSSIWLQPLWPGLILSILCWEITRGWQDWEEEREGKWVVSFLTNKQDWEVNAVIHPSVFLLLFLSLQFPHSLPLTLFFFPLSHLLSFSSSLSSSLMRAGGVSQ